MTTLTVAIFTLTYALIASRRLRFLPIGRPAGALLGATLMVASGAMTPEQSYHALDGDTLVLLLGMMLIVADLDERGLFTGISQSLLRVAKTPLRLLVATCLIAAVGSAWFVNDTLCLVLTPLVVRICVEAKLPLGPYLVVLATSANLGSAATLVGNPQNMLIGAMSGLDFRSFLLLAGPVVVLALVAQLGLAHLFFARDLRTYPALSLPETAQAPKSITDRLTLWVTLGVLVAFLAGFHLGYSALMGAVVLICLRFTEPQALFARVDWTLLLFFCGLFIVTAALRETGLVEAAWNASAPYINLESAGGITGFTALMTLGSNIVSNVPMVILTGPYLETLGDPTLGWVLLAYVTTVAGNFTLVGSVANLIVAEGARSHYNLGFWEYLRFGMCSTLVSLSLGVPLLCWWVPLAKGWLS